MWAMVRGRSRIEKKVKAAHIRLPSVGFRIPVLGSQPARDVRHKPGGRLPLLSARPAVTLANLKRAASSFAVWRTEARMGVNSLPKIVTRQRRGCDLNPGSTAPESSTLTTRLSSHPVHVLYNAKKSYFWTTHPPYVTLYNISLTHSQCYITN